MNKIVNPRTLANIAVVVLTFNQREKTLRFFSNLLSIKDPLFDVVLWDNGSQDGTEEAVKSIYPDVLVHYHATNLGVASGRNAAARLAIEQLGATHLLFLDNDILVEPGFVQELFNPLCEDRQVGQTQAKLLFQHDRKRINDGGGARINFILWQVRPVGYNEIDQGQYDVPRSCISCGGAMMVRADIFQLLGGFDSVFDPFGPEDLDFSLRLQKAGYRARYIPTAVGYHEVSHTFGRGYSEDYARHKSRHWMLFLRRHATPIQKAAFFLFGMPYMALRVAMREGRKGNFKAMRGLIQGAVNHDH